MNRNYFLLVFLLVFFNGCKTDFDLTAPYKEVPVVYGLLNKNETTHYLRIQKAYLVDGNALLAAGNLDSIYYTDSITVKLIGYDVNRNRKDSFLLHKIDGNLVGLAKDTGLFANSPNILYTFNGTLDINRTYKLEILRNGKMLAHTDDDTRKNIYLIDNFNIAIPLGAGVSNYKIPLQNTHPAEMRWNSQPNAGVYDLTVRFYYREYLSADNSLQKDAYLDVPIFKSLLSDYESGGTIKADFPGDILLRNLANNLQATPNVYRQFVKMDFNFAAGGTDLSLFVKSQQAQSGITSGDALPPYSNIINGTGILSSRMYTTVDSVLLSNNGLDTLAKSVITCPLRFKDHNGVTCQ
jgi:hypothetical protein